MRRVFGIALSAFAAIGAGACSSPPAGTDECRSIETARCKAALSCNLGITAKTETECELYARDNCLHGPVNATLPTSAVLDTCVSAIGNLGTCAKKSGVSFSAKDCIGTVTPATASVCDVIQDPEEAEPCEFLNPSPVTITPTTDAGAKDSGHD